MIPEYKIKEGDIVRVDFNGAQLTLCFKAEVLYAPCQSGDSWVFRDADTGFIHYVSEGCTLSKKIDNKSTAAIEPPPMLCVNASPMLCFKHGGSVFGEKINQEHDFTCPKCKSNLSSDNYAD